MYKEDKDLFDSSREVLERGPCEPPLEYIYKYCYNCLPLSLPIIKIEGNVSFLNENMQVVSQSSFHKKEIVLPTVELGVYIKNITPRNIEDKYQEFHKRMSALKEKVFYSKMREKPGQGIYFDFSFMTMSTDIPKTMFFSEIVSIAWADKIISSRLDTPYTVH